MNGDRLWRDPKPCHECGRPFIGYTTQIRCTACRPAFRRAQTNALSKVRYAVRRGRLASLAEGGVACTDCNQYPANHYDHRDYNKPLSVDPVCSGCNTKRGPAIPLRAVA